MRLLWKWSALARVAPAPSTRHVCIAPEDNGPAVGLPPISDAYRKQSIPVSFIAPGLKGVDLVSKQLGRSIYPAWLEAIPVSDVNRGNDFSWCDFDGD